MKREAFLQMAFECIGCPSVKYTTLEKGKDKKGFDCSGFLVSLLESSGFPGKIPRHCNEIFDSFGVFVHQPQPGDLVFFSNAWGKGYIPDHVGLMIGDNVYIHSPGKDDGMVRFEVLTLKPINKPKGKEQVYFWNPIGFKRIAIPTGRYQKMFLEP